MNGVNRKIRGGVSKSNDIIKKRKRFTCSTSTKPKCNELRENSKKDKHYDKTKEIMTDSTHHTDSEVDYSSVSESEPNINHSFITIPTTEIGEESKGLFRTLIQVNGMNIPIFTSQWTCRN